MAGCHLRTFGEIPHHCPQVEVRIQSPSIFAMQSASAVILEPKKVKSFTVSIVSPSICYEVMGLDAMILVF